MKILAIGAHQDDNEFRVGGMTVKWVRAGYEVVYLSLTNGSGGHHLLSREETIATRAKESAAVAKHLGIRYDVWADQDDCVLEANLATRKRLIRYIRAFNPDVIISHRTNDYHADHRAAALLVQDASYLLTVPHECPDVPAMRRMPVILFYEDAFTEPPFRMKYVVSIDDVLEKKMQAANLNASQVYEWLPYTYEQKLPETEEEKRAILWGKEINENTTDEEVVVHKHGYGVRFAKTAARFRGELIARYGEEKGRHIRFAEAFGLSEYGETPTEALEKALFDL
ncbi:MAG: PIG-L family deacetylase [Clostridia bacterium]|nr:PIG-L family deacetylase [Clostridia bacterium]